MIYDYENSTDEQKRRLINDFQDNNNEQSFYQLLGIYDNYLLYLVNKFQRQYYFLKNVNSQELYHESIMALKKSIISLPKQWRIPSVPLWIGSYVKQAFKQKYSKSKKEFPVPDQFLDYARDSSSAPDDKYKRFMNELDIKLVLETEILTKKELIFVQDKYYKDMSIKELQEKYGLSVSGLVKRNRIICDKLRKYFIPS